MSFTTLISTTALADHLQATWVIADCRFDLQREQWGRDAYLAAHVPGAVYISLAADLSAPLTGSNGRHPLPQRDVMAATFQRLGIDTNVQVVAYDQDNGMFASRFWWMLKYAGHDDIAVLDGGFAKWIAEGHPTISGEETRAPASFVPNWQSHLLVDVDGVKASLGRPGTLLLDARAPERFEGHTEPLDRTPGHIPGAANHFFKSNLARDNTMLPPEQLRTRFTASLHGHTPAHTVMYCGSGVTACQNLLAMEHAGLPGARLYAGSWSEWSSDPQRPVETGPAKPR
ncbi:MAG TPA: sulfurtransferase [Vicinamibacterales bacterium]|nr:sulfurtransferase [Vicinamibacterales bacterium]